MPKIALLIGSLIIAVIMGELLIRVYHSIRPVSYFTEDKLLRYRGEPFENVMGYPLNSKGFKDREHPIVTPKNSYRILGVGDSFAFGTVAYPDNYLTLLEDFLNSSDDQEFEVINMGIVGIEPPEYLRLVQSEGLSYNPDMVLLSLYVGNDFYLMLEKNMSPKKPKSFLYTYLYNTFKVLRSVDIIPMLTDQSMEDVALDKCEQYKNRMLYNINKYIRLSNGTPMVMADPENLHEISINMASIYQLDLLLKERGIELVIVLIPEELQINKSYKNSIALYVEMVLNENSNKYSVDFTLPNKDFRSIFFGNIKTIDLYNELLSRQNELSKSFYIECDGHWNKEGNLAAAEIIYSKLLELSILPDQTNQIKMSILNEKTP